MRYIDNRNTDPYFNLAAEEYLLKYSEDEVFSLWRNEASIIVGKNQNTLAEINIDYVRKNNVKVVRRLTGGGAVFHDLGNLNYTFIVNDGTSFSKFRDFCKPLIEVLKSLGIKTEFSGRNDLLIEGKKISGTAQCRHKDRVLHHGTLLFSVDTSDLAKALKPDNAKFIDKSIKSVSSRVTNISSYISKKMTVDEFRNYIFKYLMKDEKRVLETYTADEIRIINELMNNKYRTWEWNYGSSPKYEFYSKEKLSGGIIEVTLSVKESYIAAIKICGDFFGNEDISNLEKQLIGVKHKEESIRDALEAAGLDSYMLNVSVEELAKLIV